MFSIENIASDDQRNADRLVGYLAEHEDPGVRLRPQDAVNQALESGLGLMVRRNGVICGCSLVYQFVEKTQTDAYSEIGTMRITENGFDLQTLLARIHLVQMALEEHFAQDHTVFAVVGKNTASEHNLVDKVQMVPWQPPPLLEYLRRQSGVEFNPEKYSLVATPDSVSKAALSLLECLESFGGIVTPKGDQPVEVKMPWFTKAVLQSLGEMKDRLE